MIAAERKVMHAARIHQFGGPTARPVTGSP
jgi:hypothetical protein